MPACCGEYHTITLSNDGTLYSFGYNHDGQLGLGHNNDVFLPTPIPNLPKITQISCGSHFTVCVDVEGFMWSFGENNWGQLGTGNKRNFNVPQKIINIPPIVSFGDNNSGQLGTGNTTDFNFPQIIQDIPPVVSVSCGHAHTVIITTDSNLWSCGHNKYGQLCLENKEIQLKPQKTSFSNILKISVGYYHSLFQNDKGEIFSCGYNQNGQCGLGHFNSPQITPSLILKAPANIVQFVCGNNQSFFLDCEGNVYSAGGNRYGSLGLGHNTNQNELNKIPNIPPIKTISCVRASSYLIDLEGNLWTFGPNGYGQLGHGDRKQKNTPKIVNTLKDIQQISYGSSAHHFLAKNSQNQIFVIGFNNYGQLGTGDSRTISIPEEINSQYSTIWRDEFYTRAKSARK